MSGDHRALFKEKFCAVAADGECGCHNDYKKNCTPSPPWSPSFDFTWNNKKTGQRQQSYAPHHILCVASIGTMLILATDKQIDGAVKATEWCANTKRNMIAMPLWGHTVQWYCDVPVEALKSSPLSAPSFKNIPQHDWDHTGTDCYIEELEKEIVELIKDVKAAAHEAAADDLKGALNDLSDDFRGFLSTRGNRGTPGGTHEGWKAGAADTAGLSTWYLPFSMADDTPAARKAFPKLTFEFKVMKKLKWLAKQLH